MILRPLRELVIARRKLMVPRRRQLGFFVPMPFMKRYQVDSVTFDGANDRLARGAGLSGVSDSANGILSVWLRIDTIIGTVMRIIGGSASLAGPGDQVRFSRNSIGNGILFNAIGSGGSVLYTATSAGTYAVSATWKHLLCAWSSAGLQLYTNDANDLAATGSSATSNDYTIADWGVGGDPNNTNKLGAAVADLYFAPAQTLDISVQANRRKFITPEGRPMYLGTDGSVPTGTAPAVYLHVDKGEAPANFAINRGTGGNFAVTGALTVGSTSPSD